MNALLIGVVIGQDETLEELMTELERGATDGRH